MNNHEKYMNIALEEASIASQEWNAPFGVVVLDENKNIVRKDHDRVKELCDPTAHWEINAIRWLCKKLWETKLPWYTFYTTSEPCPTCLSACIKALVSSIYFWADTEKDASLPIKATELAKLAKKHPIQVIWWIIAKKCLSQRNQLLK